MNAKLLAQTYSPNELRIQKLVLAYTFSANRDVLFSHFSYQTSAIASIKFIQAFELKTLIMGFAHLEQNWDGYNAEPISSSSIATALEVLGQLENDRMFSRKISIHVFPMRSGGIQYEFDAENLSAELEIDTNGGMQFIVFDEKGNIIDRAPLFDYELSSLAYSLEDAVTDAR